jgi:hypothetical protein
MDVNRSFLEEMQRHTKAMSVIYMDTRRGSETSSSDMNSGMCTPDEMSTRGGGTDQSPGWEGEEGDGSSFTKDALMRTIGTTGTPIDHDLGGGDDFRVEEVLELERQVSSASSHPMRHRMHDP